MAFDWTGLIGPSIQLGMGLFDRRRAGREVPGMAEYISGTLAAQQASNTFSQAAADPNSAWFRNLAALFREGEEEAAMRGIRMADFQERRAIGRGMRDVRGERSDEAKIGALTDVFRRANIGSRTSAHQALLNAAGAAKGGMGNLGIPFSMLGGYGAIEASRKHALGESAAEILKKVLPEIWPGRNRTPAGAAGGYGTQGGMWGV